MRKEKLNKKKLSLMIIFSLIILIVVYFILTSEVKEIGENDIVATNSNEKIVKFDSSEYKEKAGRILGDFLSLEEESIDLNSVNNIKAGLLELRVPAEFKENHLKAVITLDEIKESFDLEIMEIEEELEKIKAIKNNLDNS